MDSSRWTRSEQLWKNLQQDVYTTRKREFEIVEIVLDSPFHILLTIDFVLSGRFVIGGAISSSSGSNGISDDVLA